MIFLLYFVPALWLAALAAHGMGKIVVWVLTALPISLSVWISNVAFPLLIVGCIAAIAGNLMMAWEQLQHKNLPKNIDTVLCYMGAIFVQVAFITSPEWLQIGTILTLFLLVPNILFYIARILFDKTDTILSSSGFFIALFFALAALTWFAV